VGKGPGERSLVLGYVESWVPWGLGPRDRAGPDFTDPRQFAALIIREGRLGSEGQTNVWVVTTRPSRKNAGRFSAPGVGHHLLVSGHSQSIAGLILRVAIVAEDHRNADFMARQQLI